MLLSVCSNLTKLYTDVCCCFRSKEKHLKRSRTDADIKLMESPSDGDASPKVLGVVEKSDSVSWVLEIDESPLTVASRMLRRANSLRGVPSNKKNKSSHGQQSLTLPSRGKKTASAASTSTPRKAAASTESAGGDASATAATPRVDHADGGEGAANAPKNENGDETAIGDIASFFDFLQDSDFETDLVASDDAADARRFYGSEKGLASPFSSTSSESSLDLELYAKEAQSRAYSRFAWSKANDAECGIRAPVKSATDSSSVSDTEDSESVDSFPSSSVDAEPKNLVQSTTK